MGMGSSMYGGGMMGGGYGSSFGQSMMGGQAHAQTDSYGNPLSAEEMQAAQ